MNLIPRFVRQHPVVSILGFCFLTILVFAVRNLLAPEQDRRFIAIREAGYPVTLSDLNSYYPAVPYDQNAALVYQQAFQASLFTNSILDDITRDREIRRGEALSEEARAKMAAFVATNAPTWQLLYSATNFSGSRYPLDMRSGYTILLPHLARVKQAAMLLSLEGLAAASTGQSNEAYAAFNAAFHAGDSLREEPILISYLVHIACMAQVAKRLEQSLNLVALQEGQLHSLQQQFAATEDSRWAARALAGERAFGLSFFIDRRIQYSVVSGAGGGAIVPSGIAGQAILTGYRASGLMAKDRNYYLDSMAKSVRSAEMTAPERVKAGSPMGPVTTNKFMFFSRTLLPALQRALDRADEHSARMRVVETALGVERYRAAHGGALPADLDQLAPQFLSVVPLDPYDAQPLRYKKLPHGYVVYSIGADQKDDGGVEPPPKEKNGKSVRFTPPDLIFVVERD